MKKQRRGQPRNNLAFYLAVSDANGSELGRLVDISEGGFQIMRDRPLPVGGLYQVRIHHPEWADSELDLRVQARAMWSRPSYNPELYDTGFQLVAPDAAQLETIRALTDLMGFRQG